MSQQYVSPFNERVSAICAAHQRTCDGCPIGDCGRREDESAIEHVKRVNAMAEDVVMFHGEQSV